MNTVESIKERRSVRTFKKEKFSEETERYINNYLESNTNSRGPFNSRVNLFKFEPRPGTKLGTYGIIKNPLSYIAGTCENRDKGLIDFGYLFEKMIVEFNKEKIGTCWMGGTFKRESFEAMIVKDSGDIMPAVTPIGYFENTRVFENLMRKMVKSDLRVDFSTLFFKGSFNNPIKSSDTNKFMIPLELVRIGPSASNKQPWRMLVSEDTNECHLYLEESPKYNNMLSYPIQLLDMGIAMYHFEEGCKSINLKGNWIERNPECDTPNNNYKYIVSYKI